MHVGTARARNIGLPEAIPATGDPELLPECVSNLLENALRHTPDGGTVVLGTRRQELPNVFLQDSGIGSPVAQQEKVFDSFFRIDTSRARGGRRGRAGALPCTGARAPARRDGRCHQ